MTHLTYGYTLLEYTPITYQERFLCYILGKEVYMEQPLELAAELAAKFVLWLKTIPSCVKGFP